MAELKFSVSGRGAIALLAEPWVVLLFLRDLAKNILSRDGASEEDTRSLHKLQIASIEKGLYLLL